MRKIVKEALEILNLIHAPKTLNNERSAMVLLALCGIGPKEDWSNASDPRLSIVGNKKGTGYPGIMQFLREAYRKRYAENSRETIRRVDIHTMIQLGVVVQNIDDPTIPTNSSRNHYSLAAEFIPVLRAFRTDSFDSLLQGFLSSRSNFNRRYSAETVLSKVTVKLPSGTVLSLSPGAHNELQGRIIEAFIPAFDPKAEVLYCGDTTDKYLFIDKLKLESIGINIAQESHTKLPDIVLYNSERNWLYLIEAVTSHGPIGKKRMHNLEEMLTQTEAGLIFITAFLTRASFRKFSHDIAWETEVWIAENPKHMVHFNGDRFMGPR